MPRTTEPDDVNDEDDERRRTDERTTTGRLTKDDEERKRQQRRTTTTTTTPKRNDEDDDERATDDERRDDNYNNVYCLLVDPEECDGIEQKRNGQACGVQQLRCGAQAYGSTDRRVEYINCDVGHKRMEAQSSRRESTYLLCIDIQYLYIFFIFMIIHPA